MVAPNVYGTAERGSSFIITPDNAISMLPHRFTIYVPSINHQGIIPDKERNSVLEACRVRLRDLSGGTTEWRAQGSYASNGQTIRESVTLLSACFARRDERMLDDLLKLSQWVKNSLEQECIAAELTSVFYLI